MHVEKPVSGKTALSHQMKSPDYVSLMLFVIMHKFKLAYQICLIYWVIYRGRRLLDYWMLQGYNHVLNICTVKHNETTHATAAVTCHIIQNITEINPNSKHQNTIYSILIFFLIIQWLDKSFFLNQFVLNQFCPAIYSSIN